MFRKIVSVALVAASVTACAGREPQQISTVQAQDANSNCMALTAEIAANTTRLEGLRRESNNTTAGNVALGVAGALLFWPALFAMDFKDAAGKEASALGSRQSYLQALAAQKGCMGEAAAAR